MSSAAFSEKLDAISDETTQQMVGIKRLVASLLHRELAAALQQWVRGVCSARGARRSKRLQEAGALLSAGEFQRALLSADEALHLGQGLLKLPIDEEATARYLHTRSASCLRLWSRSLTDCL